MSSSTVHAGGTTRSRSTHSLAKPLFLHLLCTFHALRLASPHCAKAASPTRCKALYRLHVQPRALRTCSTYSARAVLGSRSAAKLPSTRATWRMRASAALRSGTPPASSAAAAVSASKGTSGSAGSPGGAGPASRASAAASAASRTLRPTERVSNSYLALSHGQRRSSPHAGPRSSERLERRRRLAHRRFRLGCSAHPASNRASQQLFSDKLALVFMGSTASASPFHPGARKCLTRRQQMLLCQGAGGAECRASVSSLHATNALHANYERTT